MSKDRDKRPFCVGPSVRLFVGCVVKPAGVEGKLRNLLGCADGCRKTPKQPPDETHMPTA